MTYMDGWRQEGGREGGYLPVVAPVMCVVRNVLPLYLLLRPF